MSGLFPWRKKLTPRQKLGKRAEDLAVKELKKRGYTIIERNIRLKGGEIDILARQDEDLVVVEVKSLRDPAPGHHPIDGVRRAKRERLLRLAQELKRKKKIGPIPLRFDVVSVIFRGEDVEIQVFRRAFDGRGRPV